MRVLVTGHTGFIGAVMVPMLQRAGHDVVGMDTGFYDECNFLGSMARIASVRKDLRDVTREDLKGFDAVVHLAALSNDPLGDFDPELTYDINHRATARLASFAREAKVRRFLFSSSCSNYGASGGDGLLDERAAFNPVTAYGVSKVRAEKDLLELATDEFSPVLLRSATAYGVSPRLRCDIVLNNLTAWAVATGKVLIKSDGTPWRPIVHVEDICRAFAAALEAPRDTVHAQAFNVGRPEENYRISELAEIVRDTVPGCTIEFAGGAQPDARNYRVDTSKIARELPAFRPQWTARKGAQQLYQAFREARIGLEDIEGWRYRRIGQLRKLLEGGRLAPDLRWRS
ncbi:MAG: NAD-dependent epimerase/dehydratase family protein [Myxococcales bacterium]